MVTVNQARVLGGGSILPPSPKLYFVYVPSVNYDTRTVFQINLPFILREAYQTLLTEKIF